MIVCLAKPIKGCRNYTGAKAISPNVVLVKVHNKSLFVIEYVQKIKVKKRILKIRNETELICLNTVYFSRWIFEILCQRRENKLGWPHLCASHSGKALSVHIQAVSISQ